jgi:hypothetical protein
MFITNIIAEQHCITDYYTQLTVRGGWCMMSHSVPDQKSQYINIRWASRLERETLCPIHCRGKMVFRYSHASMLKWSVAPTCMKHILWQISSTSTGRQVLPRTWEIYTPLEENHGQCHTGLMENLYRWLRFLVTLSLVKDPSTVYGTMLGNQSSSTWHWKHQCLNSCFLLGPQSHFFASDMGETVKQCTLGEGASITIFKTTPSNLGMQTYLCHPQPCLLILSVDIQQVILP